MRTYTLLPPLFLTLLVSGGGMVLCLDLATQEDLSEYGPNQSNFTKDFEEYFRNYDEDDFLKDYSNDDGDDETFHRHHRHASTDDYDGLKEGSGWSTWSSWSGCSRTCGGGASMQSRRCMDHNGCRGDSVRYRVCNDVSCEKNAQEFRAVQCAEYDGLPHDGKLYEWEPALSEEPCSLTCRAKGGGPVVTLNSRVHDGTRCYDGQDDHMCINGRCQKIGCDMTLGSGLELDECGVCGGNGSTCNRPDFYWDSQPTGPCSTTCGGGYQILSSVCLDRKDNRVNEDRCDHSTRPHSHTATCNDHTCPTRWQAGSWASCSSSCGTGYQLREVYCTEPRGGNDIVKVADHYCTNKRPVHRQKCNTHDCPQWYYGFWSKCSTTCGSGIQTRAVHCRDARDRSSETCDPTKRPPDTRPCRTGVTCPQPPLQQHPQHQNTPSWWGEEAGGGLASEEGAAPLMPRPQALTTDQQVPSEPTYMTGNWSACSLTCGDGVRTRSVTCKIFLEFSRTVAVLPDDQCPGIKPPASNGCMLPPCPHAMTRDAAHEPMFGSLEDPNEPVHKNKGTDDDDDPKINETPFLPLLVDEDAANTPRAVDEDVFNMSAGDLPVPQAQAYNKPHPALHSFEAPSDHTQFVPDDPNHRSHFDYYDSYEIANNKAHSQKVKGRTADMNSIEIDLSGGEEASSYSGSYLVGDGEDYKWTTSGFSPCSASCLGGVQESVVRCIRKQDEKIVDPVLCQLAKRPDIITKTCNDQPCPPRWNITDFHTCNQQCGGGIQVREVLCIHEVTRGGRNTLTVPDSLCPQPPPHAQRHCNMLDCMPSWAPGKWSKCSKTCGGGVKTREVTCQQTLSLGQVVDKPHTDCPRRRPAHIRKCNKRACHPNTIGQISQQDHPIIYAQIRQNYVQGKFMKKITLKVGGSATVFRGVMVKVKCPVRRFDRSRITWWFEGSQVGSIGNSIVTSKGVLKIRKVQYVDAGVYICRAGLSEAKLKLMVKALPASFSSSEERHPPGGEKNEVSQIGYGSPKKSSSNRINKDYKSWVNTGSERRKGRRRNRDRNRNKSERKQASSKNIHTVEEGSNEASNTLNTDQSSTRRDYIYGTVTHHSSDTLLDKDGQPYGKGPLDKWQFETDKTDTFGSINHLTDENTDKKEKSPVFGKINHHSKGGRITSEENHIFGTISHHKPPETTNLTDPPERTPIYSLESSGNSVEEDLKSLGNKLSLSEESSLSNNNQRTVGRGGRHVSGDHGGLEAHDLLRDSDSTTEDPLGTPQFLGKGTRDSLEFEWRMTNWSECSQTCGFSGSSGGYQVRSTQCVVWVNNVSTPVNSELCTNAGLATPATFQRCGLEECPQWHVNDWSDCETSRCFTLHYAFQRREVQCRLHNETEVGSERCDERTKPRHRRECYNHQCTGVWRVEDWSECTAPCGGQGYRTRVLQCVWNGTKKAAGNACREQPRPEVVRWCDGAPCLTPSM